LAQDGEQPPSDPSSLAPRDHRLLRPPGRKFKSVAVLSRPMREPAPPIFAHFVRWAAAPAPASGGGLCKKESKMTQAATIDPAVDLATPEVDIDLVHIVEGYNPRKLMDKAKLAEMSASMKEIGMLKPLLVVPVGDHFELVAGERRHKAAHEAGLKKVPITIRHDGNRELMTAVENTQQEELDPVAKATSWKMVAEARGLTTNKQIAEAVFEKSVDTVGAHMRLLRLPEGVQRYFAEGVVNLDAEKPLREVARISPRVAECVCEVARRRKVKPGRFVDRFEDLLDAVTEEKFDDPPTMIRVFGASLDQLVADPEKREGLLARLGDLWPGQTVDGGFRVNFSQEEIDRSRAARVLVEHKRDSHGYAPLRYICDAEFAADLADCWVDRRVKEAEKDRRARAKAAAQAKADQEGVNPSASDDEQAEQRKKAEAKRKREAAKERREQAGKVASNEDIGRRMSRRHGKRAEQRAVARLDVLIDMLFDAHPNLGAGLRLVLAQLREQKGEDIKYATVREATDYLRDRVARADSVAEKVELLIEAVLADQVADASVLPLHQRWTGNCFALDEEAQKALAPEIKALTPVTGPKKK